MKQNSTNFYTWEKIPAEDPRARDSHTLVYFKEKLILFGGCGAGKENSFGDLWQFNLRTKEWTKLTTETGDVPPPREGHVAIALDENKMFVHGGINFIEESFDDCYVLDGIDSLKNLQYYKCDQKGDVPTARDSHTAVLMPNSGKVYLFGGQGKNDKFYNEIYSCKIHEIKTNKKKSFVTEWKQIKVNGDQPVPRTSHSCVAYRNRYLIVIGGETEQEQSELKNSPA